MVNVIQCCIVIIAIIGACYRLQISDGNGYQPCMVATQLNNKFDSGEIEQFAIISLDKYECNVIQGKKSAIFTYILST